MNEQEIQTPEFENTQGTPLIDDNVLNTPAKDPRDFKQEIPDNSVKHYLDLNKPQKFNPQGDVVLDLDGKKVQVRDDSVTLETKSNLLTDIYGEDAAALEKDSKSGTYLIFGLVILGLFFFVYLSLKRNEHILNLERELEKLKMSKK